EKINPPVDLGQEIIIHDVLMIGGEKSYVGAPTLKDAKVTVVVTKQAKTRKVFVFKKKRRNGYRKFKTHRQEFTELFVKAITTPDGKTEATDLEATIVDMEAKREGQIQAKKEAKLASLSREKNTEEEVVSKKVAAPKKKAKAAPKKPVKGMTSKKKTAKKAVKKTAKKAAKK
nr:50S ribosomal protein L21 [Pseudobdellovibrionaceae bacterium]